MIRHSFSTHSQGHLAAELLGERGHRKRGALVFVDNITPLLVAAILAAAG